MAIRGNLKIAALENERARKAGFKRRVQSLIKKVQEFFILCNMAVCLIIFNHDDKKLTVWPSPEGAKSLLDKFFALSYIQRNMKAMDQESFINHNIKLIEKKLAKARKVNNDIEMDNLLLQLQMGRRKIGDLSDAEINNLKTYSEEKLKKLAKEIGSRKKGNTSVNEPASLRKETPSTLNSRNDYHVSGLLSSINLNVEPSYGGDNQAMPK